MSHASPLYWVRHLIYGMVRLERDSRVSVVEPGAAYTSTLLVDRQVNLGNLLRKAGRYVSQSTAHDTEDGREARTGCQL